MPGVQAPLVCRPESWRAVRRRYGSRCPRRNCSRLHLSYIVTPHQYKRAREVRGTQVAVSRMLGVHQVTIARRETGALPITREAALALAALPLRRPQPRPRRGARSARPLPVVPATGNTITDREATTD